MFLLFSTNYIEWWNDSHCCVLLFISVTTSWIQRLILCCHCVRTQIFWTQSMEFCRVSFIMKSRHLNTKHPTCKVKQLTSLIFMHTSKTCFMFNLMIEQDWDDTHSLTNAGSVDVSVWSVNVRVWLEDMKANEWVKWVGYLESSEWVLKFCNIFTYLHSFWVQWTMEICWSFL